MPFNRATRIGHFCGKLGDFLEYEPSWIAEFSVGLGLLWWATGGFMTSRYLVAGYALLFPLVALALGVFRLTLLWLPWFYLRSIAAFFSALFWGWIFIAVVHWFGLSPGMAGPGTFFVTDMLIMTRFSLPAAREIIADRKGLHATL